MPLEFVVDLSDRAGRDNALTFEGDSYIARTELPGAGGFDLDITLQDTSFAIESTVSQPPAINWVTPDVDVRFEVDGEQTRTFEMIAEDSCNLWFADAAVSGNRCQKHWRSLAVAQGLNINGTLQLVDGVDNHVCGTPETPPPPPDGALYLVGDLGTHGNLSVDFNTTLDMNNIAVYYAGTVTNNGTIDNAPPNFPMKLKMTVYGDFNGDCDVDNTDVQIITNFLGSALSRCDWPLADSNADCSVDFLDVAAVMGRIGIQPWPGCDPEETTNCSIPEGGLGLQEEPPPAPEAGFVTFADALVAFTAGQAPVDSEELRLLNQVMDSLLSVCKGRFDVNQRARLAARLESRDIEFATREAAACAAALANRLRE